MFKSKLLIAAMAGMVCLSLPLHAQQPTTTGVDIKKARDKKDDRTDSLSVDVGGGTWMAQALTEHEKDPRIVTCLTRSTEFWGVPADLVLDEEAFDLNDIGAFYRDVSSCVMALNYIGDNVIMPRLSRVGVLPTPDSAEAKKLVNLTDKQIAAALEEGAALSADGRMLVDNAGGKGMKWQIARRAYIADSGAVSALYSGRPWYDEATISGRSYKFQMSVSKSDSRTKSVAEGQSATVVSPQRPKK